MSPITKKVPMNPPAKAASAAVRSLMFDVVKVFIYSFLLLLWLLYHGYGFCVKKWGFWGSYGSFLGVSVKNVRKITFFPQKT